MGYSLHCYIDDETKKKIRALVESGYGEFFLQKPVEFYMNHNYTMFKKSIDSFYKKIFFENFHDAHYGHPE